MQLFDVSGMTCDHCVRTVTQAIKAIDPAATVQVDLDAKQVWVDSAAAAATLTAAIEAKGYQVYIASAGQQVGGSIGI